VFLAKAEP